MELFSYSLLYVEPSEIRIECVIVPVFQSMFQRDEMFCDPTLDPLEQVILELEEGLMSEKDGTGKGLDTEVIEGNANSVERMQDWLANPEAYFQEMEKAETLIARLLQEREALLKYIKALRFWAYEIIGGSVNPNVQPTDMSLLEAMMSLPDYLRKEIQSYE